MANEITLTTYFQYAVSGRTYVDQRIVAQAFDQTAPGMCDNIVTVATTEQTLDVGGISTAGYALFINLDAANFVQIGTATGVYALKLKKGQFAVVPLAAKTLYAKADTATVKVAYWILEA